MSNRPGRKIARKQSHTRAAASTADRQREQQTRIVLGIGIIIAVAVVVTIFAVAFSGGDEESPVAISGDFLPLHEEGVADPAIGAKAPIFVAETFEGERVVTGGSGGPNDTGKVIAFVAHWCPTCQAELPKVADWLRTTELPDGVEVMAVSTFEDASRDNHPPSDWFQAVDWPTTAVADDDGAIATAYGFQRIPSWVVLDDFNRVLMRTTGVVSETDLSAMAQLASDSLS